MESESPQSQCDNASCGNQVPSSIWSSGVLCSGCSGARYCAAPCQEVSWASHKAICTVPKSVKLGEIRLHCKIEEEDEDEDEDGYDSDEDMDSTCIKNISVDIEYKPFGSNTAVKIGYARLVLVDIEKTRSVGFFFRLDDESDELSNFAVLFDDEGPLRPNSGCWQPEDFDEQDYLVVLTELVVDIPWREQGIGRSVFQKLFKLEQLHGSRFIFAWPTAWASSIQKESTAAYSAKCDRVVKFFQKSAFRRVVNSRFFCLANDIRHASHSIPLDQDAPYHDSELPPTITLEEAQRYMDERYMAQRMPF
ncbi:hypothetical protein FB45DRAFT_891036 [Roridomyces roridus]|uniref:MYND-type domain-containing protein n=1 Tax=Roridomyces roridus TaxID=1738132 RepID=A0AAD7CE34_9AGAR|nr:hypothetical protein FB45DRAFT_891036 [Roridomyces roridus]